ncbi:hypothetical protein GCM10010406_04130 [Streptomyces thermolineatus]|uniref:Uncharacterized protein n=1 Tax=Streptomyces thermolineatus TaxID=44033 RepID=A0ABN3KY44_9ACTN
MQSRAMSVRVEQSIVTVRRGMPRHYGKGRGRGPRERAVCARPGRARTVFRQCPPDRSMASRNRA